MKRLFTGMVLVFLLLSMAALCGCETFAKSFADQAGRNTADVLFGK